MNRLRSSLAAVVFASFLRAAHAQAPPDDAARDTARMLAETGKKRLDAGDYAGAIDALRDAEKYYRAPTITRVRALAHEKLGKLVEARDIYAELAREGLDAGAPAEFSEAIESAKTSLEALDKRIPVIELTLKSAPPGTRVTLDANLVDLAALGGRIRVNPGRHAIVIELPDTVRIIREIESKEGTTDKIEIHLTPGPKPSGQTSTPPAPSGAVRPPGDTGPRRVPVATYVAYGVGAASLVAGGILGALRLSKNREFDESPSYEIANQGTHLAIAADLAFTAALMCAVAGTVTWLRGPAEPKPTKTSHEIVVAPTPFGAVVTGKF